VLKIYLYTCGNQRFVAPRLQLLQGLQKTLVIEFKTVDEKWNDFYDGSQIKPDMTQANEGMAGQILSNGKRAFSNMIIGSARPHKCRKLNHSQNAASSVLNAIVPDFVLQASSCIFRSSDAAAGGITKIVHDAERQCLYTLSAKGWISSYDLWGELKMTSQMDAVKTARVYLEAVSSVAEA
jgi:Nup133 N terminal like